MTFPKYLIPRQYVWTHELAHVTAAWAAGWEPLAATSAGVHTDCWYAAHPLRVVRAAPHLALRPHGLSDHEDWEEFAGAYPGGDCDHPLAARLADPAYFRLLWRAVKKHWRGHVLTRPLACPLVAAAANFLAEG